MINIIFNAIGIVLFIILFLFVVTKAAELGEKHGKQ